MTLKKRNHHFFTTPISTLCLLTSAISTSTKIYVPIPQSLPPLHLHTCWKRFDQIDKKSISSFAQRVFMDAQIQFPIGINPVIRTMAGHPGLFTHGARKCFILLDIFRKCSRHTQGPISPITIPKGTGLCRGSCK